MNKSRVLSSNVLKIIAIIAMTIDHIGYILLPDLVWMRIIGRIAFPVFAFLIAEGCKYTKNKLKYFLLVFGLGVFCQIFSYFVGGQTKLNILLTFSFSIGLVYLLNWLKKCMQSSNIKKSLLAWLVFIVAIAATLLITSNHLNIVPIKVDYGFWGVLIPVLVSIFDNHYAKVAMLALGLIMLSFGYGLIQWFSLIAVLIVLFYNGKRGKYKLKYFFYAYYPLHLAVIYLISFAF